jgi:Zn-finger domain-containing protein
MVGVNCIDCECDLSETCYSEIDNKAICDACFSYRNEMDISYRIFEPKTNECQAKAMWGG